MDMTVVAASIAVAGAVSTGARRDMAEGGLHHPVYRVFEIGRHAGPLEFGPALSASEQMFFFEAPVAHVVAWQVEQLVLLASRASGNTFSTRQRLRSMVPLGWATEALVRALVR